jgi:Domain of unknown function (DUF397)
MEWRKSSFSGANGGACVEVASADNVAVRDTTDRDSVTLEFTPRAWQEFTSRLRGSLREGASGSARALSRPLLAATVERCFFVKVFGFVKT